MARGYTLLLVVALALGLAAPVLGDPFNQLFQPLCAPLPDSTKATLRWSSASTWQASDFNPNDGISGAPSFIPGVGAGAGVNVTIPCGFAVLLDVPNLSLNVLTVEGFLQVEDVSSRVYNVTASFVVVKGQLVAGSLAKQFSAYISFLLVPNPNARHPLSVSAPAFPNKTTTQIVTSTANVGHKAFAVVGGQLRLHGLPGNSSTPSWIKLSATVNPGGTSIRVDRDVSRLWPLGGTIALASTDYEPSQAETANIVGFSAAAGGCTILLDRALNYSHFGDPLYDSFGGYIDERAEVALLSRRIVIRGLEEAAYPFEGGHFIIVQTNAPQYVEGVEFAALGQQGTLGRYSFHFHVCADTGGRSIVRKNAVHDSLQRCMVLHATHNVTLEANVAFNTVGHCFLTEEGGEQGNLFLNNLGMRTVGPDKDHVISQMVDGKQVFESDGEPATFWITNLLNDHIGNVGAGSTGTGIWFEMKTSVRGMSLNIPELEDIKPLTSGGATIRGNTMHSNTVMGVRTYPSGVRPTNGSAGPGAIPYGSASDMSMWDGVTQGITFDQFNIYKHRSIGMFFQGTGGVLVTNSTFADNNRGILMQSNTRGVVRNSRFIGYTNNLGTVPPLASCGGRYGAWVCAPVSGCTFPPTSQSNVRSMIWYNWRTPQFGIVIVGAPFIAVNSPHGRLFNNSFSGFDPSCRTAAAISPGYPMGAEWWDAAQGFSQHKLAPGVPAVWFPTPTVQIPVELSTWTATPVMATDLVMYDRDGSAVGGAGGYIVANNSFLLPPPSIPCTPLPNANALACPGACYRTVLFQYADSTPLPVGRNWGPGDLSYLTIVRDEDGHTRTTWGNPGYASAAASPAGAIQRWFYVSLLADRSYTISISPPYDPLLPFPYPPSLRISFADGWDGQKPCGKGITFRVLPQGSSGKQWVVQDNDYTFRTPCPGTTTATGPSTTTWPLNYTYTCPGPTMAPVVTLSGSTTLRTQFFTLFSQDQRAEPCDAASTVCGLVPSSDFYWYNTSGVEQRTLPAPMTGYQTLAFNGTWSFGEAVIGFVQVMGPPLATKTNAAGTGGVVGVRRITFYFRKTFNISNPACYSGLVLEYLPVAGIMAFLNGVEILRYNLPTGAVNATTFASAPSVYSKTPAFTRAPTIALTPPGSSGILGTQPALVQGTNVIAFETHVSALNVYTNYFDSRVSLISTCVSSSSGGGSLVKK